MISGLKNMTCLNGLIGTFQGINEEGRYRIAIQDLGEGAEKYVKPENCCRPSSKLEISTSAADFNIETSVADFNIEQNPGEEEEEGEDRDPDEEQEEEEEQGDAQLVSPSRGLRPSIVPTTPTAKKSKPASPPPSIRKGRICTI